MNQFAKNHIMFLRLLLIIGVVGLLSLPVEAWAIEPQVQELILQGNRLCEQGEYQQAVAKYLGALKGYSSPDAAYNLGVTYEINLRDMKQALNYYQQFLSLEPESDDARQVRGWMEEIRVAYPHITSQQPKKPEELSLQSRQRVGADLKSAQDLYRQGKYEAAAHEYLEVLQLYDSADACYNLGLIYDKKLNQKQLAIEYYQKFLGLEPKSPDAKRVRHWIDQARKALQSP